MRKVALFFGGNSCENEISVLTGVFVLNVLDNTKYEVIPVYVHTDGGMYTAKNMRDLSVFRERKYAQFERVFFDGGSLYALNGAKKKIKSLGKIDVALNACHGGWGEGGGVSALMEINGIPLASPGMMPSAVFMDKCITKKMLRALNVPIVDYLCIQETDYLKRGAFMLKSVETRLGYPVVVKPAKLGSSIGISVARDENQLKTAITTAFQLDTQVLIEQYLEEKKDVNCAVCSLHGEVCVAEPEEAFGAGVYTFEEKYVRREKEGKNAGRCGLKAELIHKIKAYAKSVYKRTNMFGVVRMDFLVSGQEVYLCEVNTVPGSLAYYFFCERVSDARIFFADVLEEAIQKHKTEQKKVLSTGILQSVKWQRK